MKRHKTTNDWQLHEKFFGNPKWLSLKETNENEQKKSGEKHAVKYQNLGAWLDEFSQNGGETPQKND